MVLFSVCKYTKKCQDTQAFAMLFNPNWAIDRLMNCNKKMYAVNNY